MTVVCIGGVNGDVVVWRVTIKGAYPTHETGGLGIATHLFGISLGRGADV